jgi:hypothetical protein
MFADAAAKKIKQDLRKLDTGASFKVTTMRRMRVLIDISDVSPSWLRDGDKISDEAHAFRDMVEAIAAQYRTALPNPFPYDITVTYDRKILQPVLQDA